MTRLRTPACAPYLVCLLLVGCAGTPQARRDRYLARGKQNLAQGDTARALLEFKNAAKVAPNDAEAYYQLGLVYDASQDARSAVSSLRKALELNPKHPGAQLKLAEMMAATDNRELLQDAQSRFKTLLDGGSENPEALNSLALTELKLGNIGDAVQNLEQSLARSPGDLNTSVVLAWAKLQQKDAKGAEDILTRLSSQQPKSADARRILGEFYVDQSKLPEAEAQFRSALGIDPKNGPALADLSRLQLTQGHPKEAEQGFQQLAALPGYKLTYGLFLFQQGRRDDAVREFERVVRENPDDRQARTDLLVAYRAAGRQADADRVLTGALQKNAKDSDALLQRAELAIEAGNYPRAEEDLNHVAALLPRNPATESGVAAGAHRISAGFRP
jgi:tetratricopeptide (TPR) repeat protein